MGAVATGLVVLLLAETAFPSRPGRPARERLLHIARNGGLALVTTLLVSTLSGGALLTLLRSLEMNRVGLLHLVDTPVWLQVVVGFVALDFADYVFHRMSHEVNWLWLLHSVHHSDPDVDVTTNLRVHPLHAVFTALTKLVTVAAFGFPLWVWMLRELIALPIVQLQHSAVRMPHRLERLLALLFITPALHRVHHSVSPMDNNRNFGGVVPWWDWLFGTYRDSENADTHELGLSALREASWQTVWGMCATPFRARRLGTL
jgi:sterol desaturase/sphingolipid hydroxylase (fatty acid hydroxylase superfamily)